MLQITAARHAEDAQLSTLAMLGALPALKTLPDQLKLLISNRPHAEGSTGSAQSTDYRAVSVPPPEV
nr:hypothetical protein [Nitrosomonas nitrosa]